MAVLDIILRKRSIVLDSSLLDEISRDGLLKKGITNVFLVSKDALDGAEVPLVFLSASLDSINFPVMILRMVIP